MAGSCSPAPAPSCWRTRRCAAPISKAATRVEAVEALSETSLGVFIGVTVVLGGGAGILTGRAVAATWRPVSQLLFACVGLGLA
ncbi:MAG TPA: hypothetical protein VGB88_06440, partial [Alphaproteobacteria bacterium]